MDNNPFILGAIFTPLLAALLTLLLSDNRQKRYVGLAAGLLAWLSSLMVLQAAVQDGPQTYRLGGWTPPFGIVFVGDMLSALFVTMASTVMLGGLLYILHCWDKSLKHPAFMALFLSMEAGLLGAFFTGDVFTLFVFIELMVISSVSMVAIADSKFGLEAAIKYLFISAMGSLFLLLGIAAIYATFGTLNFADLAQQLSTGERPFLSRAAAVMLMCAFLLKSAVFPFHFWQPDFHTTAPTPLSAMLSSVVVKVGVYGMIRMTTLLFVEEAGLIQSWLIGLGLISIFFGSLSAMRTYNGKRMLAYSTFGQVGFILLGIGWGTPLALTAAIVYAFNHAFIKSALLLLMGAIASRTATKTSRLSDIAGFGKNIHPIVGVLFLIGGLALAGVPPMNGFVSKLLLIRSGLDAEAWLATGLAVAAGVITLFYMTRAWQLIFQQNPTEQTVVLRQPRRADSLLAPALLLSACLLLGVYATPLYNLASDAAAEMNNPQTYINAVNPFDGDSDVAAKVRSLQPQVESAIPAESTLEVAR